MENLNHLSARQGFILGSDSKGKRYIADDNRHILLLAPTGSGKGVSVMLPNLLFEEGSAIVHDVKLENYELTSGWRASQGHKIFVWAPLERKLTHRFNPLNFISTQIHEMANDIQKIAGLLIEGHEFWQVQARSLFVGLVFYLMAHPLKQKSIGEVSRMVTNTKDLITDIAKGSSELKESLHPLGAAIIESFLSKTEQENSGVISTLYSYLELWTNPLIDYATSASDFDISTFKQVKTTLYVGVRPADFIRLQPLMQFFYQYAFGALMNNQAEERVNISFYMDECTSVGAIPNLLNAVTYGRGYKIQLVIVSQNLGDLKEVYGKHGAHTILFNCSFKICFGTESYKTAKMLSKLCVERVSVQEIMSLSKEEELIFVSGHKPVKAKKIRYFEEQDLKDKILPPASS